MGKSPELEQVNTSRQFEVDCVRFFAILFMVCIHVYEFYTDCDYGSVMPDTVYRNVIEFLGGPMSAPVFMFAMGIGMVYTRHKTAKDFIKRGWKLLLLGYILNIVRETVPQLIELYKGMEPQFSMVNGLLNVDILHFAGMAFLTIGVMKKLDFSPRLMFAIALLMQGIGIWANLLTIRSEALQDLLGLILPTGRMVAFPLTLWLIYPVLGMIFGGYLVECYNKKAMYRKLMCCCVIFFLVYTVSLIYMGVDIREFYALYDDIYYDQTFLNTLWNIPLIVVALGTSFFLFSGLENTIAGRFIRFCSEKVIVIYIVQWIIILHTVEQIYILGREKMQLSPGVIVLAAASILGMSFGITWIYHKIKLMVQ